MMTRQPLASKSPGTLLDPLTGAVLHSTDVGTGVAADPAVDETTGDVFVLCKSIEDGRGVYADGYLTVLNGTSGRVIGPRTDVTEVTVAPPHEVLLDTVAHRAFVLADYTVVVVDTSRY